MKYVTTILIPLTLLALSACAHESADVSQVDDQVQSDWTVTPDAFPRPTDAASSPSEDPDLGPASVDTNAPPVSSNPEDKLCIDLGDLSQFPSCCDEAPAKCLPKEAIGPGFQSVVAPCGDDGLCIPEPMFDLKGVMGLRPCSAVAGIEGACVSRCVPKVAESAALLSQDVCEDGDLCVPCVSPLDGQDTGVCGVFDCNNPKTDTTSEPEVEPTPEPTPGFTCEEPPQVPLLDPSVFPLCCDGARCIPEGLVPEDLQDNLDPCDEVGGSLCVPEPFIAWGDFYQPQHCELGDGSAGRCMSTCLPKVAERADQLPQAGCPDNELCSPCCDFYTGETTGSCGFGCDTWAEEDGVCDYVYDECCPKNGGGHCVPSANIPADLLESVERLSCEKGDVCVPDEITDPDIGISVCTGSIPFLNEPYTGVCLSKCIKLPLDILIMSGSCPNTHDCVPCLDPLTGGPTGAPGCDQL